MRVIKLGLLGLLGLVLVIVALANRAPVTVRLMPADIEALIGWNWQDELPLFVVMFGGAVVGLLIGVVWEWLREHRQRAEAAEMRRALERMETELGRLRPSAARGREEGAQPAEAARGR
ncbi:MAG: DUF1049 domain-containing protein [Rhodobacteraceae bacterium]|jgi:uncharacterized integral membrane protein|nr:DUF1049 domain-containing protein [Paracoccaceae bacterium]